MYATIDELTGEPVAVTLEGDRVRIRYGRGATFSLDIGEALALVDAVGTVLERQAAQSNTECVIRGIEAGR
ncbi:hypothetical protein [Rhodococcoides yunnanense]|jgi:hypothetical protein|uniref:hypothetical protein n=1 Tax=Rhodococcoides yunnanense TaxID=278209 RepID=UPI0022B14657|nr:hypothetical protein [Rhodococcus yunnanensis]MCZ4276253.1 hypothetical protein [Rhodococcus yunnanensis]